MQLRILFVQSHQVAARLAAIREDRFELATHSALEKRLVDSLSRPAQLSVEMSRVERLLLLTNLTGARHLLQQSGIPLERFFQLLEIAPVGRYPLLGGEPGTVQRHVEERWFRPGYRSHLDFEVF